MIVSENRVFRIMLSPPVNAVGYGAGRHATDQDIDAGVQGGRERKQRQSQYQRQDIGELPTIARGRKQKCQRRQQQHRGSKQLREIGCEGVANRICNEADGNKTCTETWVKAIRRSRGTCGSSRKHSTHKVTAMKCVASTKSRRFVRGVRIIGSTETTIGNSRIALTVTAIVACTTVARSGCFRWWFR